MHGPKPRAVFVTALLVNNAALHQRIGIGLLAVWSIGQIVDDKGSHQGRHLHSSHRGSQAVRREGTEVKRLGIEARVQGPKFV